MSYLGIFTKCEVECTTKVTINDFGALSNWLINNIDWNKFLC